MKVIADLHTHTTYSQGKGTVLDNIAAAMAQGYKAIGITEHGPRSAPWAGASLQDLEAMRREVSELDRRAVGMRVLAGVECNIISASGDLDVPAGLRQQLDIVLAGLHPGILPKSGTDWLALAGSNWAARISRPWGRRARAINTRAVVEAVLRNDIDVITHPGHLLDIDTAELARACAMRGTALEISARHREMTAEFCRLAAREGALFVISSDAHSPCDVGDVARGLAVAKAAGLTPAQVLNVEGGALFEWLERKRARRARQSGWEDWAAQPALDRAGRAATPGGPRREEEGQERRRSYWTDWSSQGKIH